MRIGLIYHQFQSDAGGLERYLHGFASHLSNGGHDLILIGGTFDESFSALPGAATHPILCRGSKTARLRQFADRSSGAAQELNLDVSLGFGRTYAQDLHRAGGGCHKVYSRFLPPHKQLRRKNQVELALEEQLYTGGETAHFIVNAGLVGRQIQEEYGVSKDRISVVHTPVDTDSYAPAADPVAARIKACKILKTDTGRPAFLFVSLNHRRKGLNGLLEAWPAIDADLWIAGTPLRSAQKRLIRQHGIGGQIRHLGQSGDLVPYYQAADGFLHPTLYDACANTVLQSMACGLPGLISSRDGASEFIRDGENGFRLENPEDSESIRNGIKRILELADGDRRKMAERARQTVTPLTWKSHLGRWRDAIEKVRAKKSVVS